MHILVTGGTGYIGSHTAVELLNSGHEVTIIDNLNNSKIAVLPRIEAITGKKPEFFQADLLDQVALDQIFSKNKFDAVIHFAGYKAVGESVKNPLLYYQNNFVGSLTLFQTMIKYNVKNLIFSSSCTVYGMPEKTPITEDFPLKAYSPYGWTKLMIEQMLKDMFVSDPSWNIIILRYFNPVGAHPSGSIGENPLGIPNNLMPLIVNVAAGKIPELQVYGNDYQTPDGSCVRDYIHVVDLSVGHVKAADKLKTNPGLVIYNLGTGHGVSVLEIIRTFEEATGQKVPYTITSRRPGDVPAVFANPSKAETELNWKATRTLADMCTDSWRWQSQNPHGY